MDSEDLEWQLGPQYFGCIRMTRSRFLTIVLLCEVLYFLSTILHIIFIYGWKQYQDIQVKEDDTFHELKLEENIAKIRYNNSIWFGFVYFIIFNMVPMIIMVRAKVKYEKSINVSEEEARNMDQCKSTHTLYTRFIIVYIVRLILLLVLTICYFLKISSFFDIVQINITNDQTFMNGSQPDLEIEDTRDMPMVLAVICYVLFTIYQIYIIYKFNQIRQHIKDMITY